MPVDPSKFYKTPLETNTPTYIQNLEWALVPVREVHTSGKVSAITSSNFNSGIYTDNLNANVSASASVDISSKSVCTGYDLIIKYTGPIDIGERTIITKRVRNYAQDEDIWEQSEELTGISPHNRAFGCIPPFSSAKIQSFACFTFVTCLFIFTETCFKSCLGSTKCIDDRREIFFDQVRELAHEKASKEVAEHMEQADKLVAARIAQKQSEQGNPQNALQIPGGSGMTVIMSPQQLSAFVQWSANQNGVYQHAVAMPNPPAAAFLMQYPQQQPQRLADAPAALEMQPVAHAELPYGDAGNRMAA